MTIFAAGWPWHQHHCTIVNCHLDGVYVCGCKTLLQYVWVICSFWPRISDGWFSNNIDADWPLDPKHDCIHGGTHGYMQHTCSHGSTKHCFCGYQGTGTDWYAARHKGSSRSVSLLPPHGLHWLHNGVLKVNCKFHLFSLSPRPKPTPVEATCAGIRLALTYLADAERISWSQSEQGLIEYTRQIPTWDTHALE